MEPLERLLNLVGLLLETPIPLTFEQIRETLEAYRSDNLDSAKRKFERDKDILREYGVPLEMAPTDAWDVEQGYRIRKDRYYLPEIAFTPEEVTALFVAAQGASEETAATQGVRKLLYGADGGLLAGDGGGPLIAGSDARIERVLAAADAASGHRRIRFGYRTSQGSVSDREVDALRGGVPRRSLVPRRPRSGARRDARVPPVALHDRDRGSRRGERAARRVPGDRPRRGRTLAPQR